MLRIKNLYVSVEGKQILRGVNLNVKPGEVHAIMGPNGSGKSTLAYAIAGHPRYEVVRKLKAKSEKLKAKTILEIDGKSLLDKTPDQRARLGLFLAFQYPVSVEGVTIEQLLRKVVQQRKANSEKLKTNALEFRKYLMSEAKKLGVKEELLKRSINDGFSGGEKKRLEILQMTILKPKYAILDETDSGLDIDALKVIAKGVELRAKSGTGVILITHYQRLLKFVKPDWVHVMVNGRIMESGGEEVARRLEKEGYKKYA